MTVTDTSDPERPERDYVDLDSPADVEEWTHSLGITQSELERAVEIAGPRAGEVYDYVCRSRQTRQPSQ